MVNWTQSDFVGEQQMLIAEKRITMFKKKWNKW